MVTLPMGLFVKYVGERRKLLYCQQMMTKSDVNAPFCYRKLCYTKRVSSKKPSYYAVSIPVTIALRLSPATALIAPERYLATFSVTEQTLHTVTTKAQVQALLNQKQIVSDALCEIYPEYKDAATELIITGAIRTTKIRDTDTGFQTFLAKTGSFVFISPLP
jgi:hypothetical protein